VKKLETNGKIINQEILKIAADENIPVIGIAHADKMAAEPQGFRPTDYLPGAQSLICIGIPIPLGAYQVPTHNAEIVWRSQNLYYRRLDSLSIRLATMIEESGSYAIPIYGCMPLGINQRREVVGYLNQIQMGVVTKIGILGKNGLLINSKYGARLMLGGVITRAALPEMHFPDLIEPGCPPDCRICVDACPVHAISLSEKRVKIMRCLGYTARTPLMSKLMFYLLRSFRPSSAARLMNLTAFDEHTFHTCSRCVSQCPYGL
jgi:epoxyqueuosine reductase QueG